MDLAHKYPEFMFGGRTDYGDTLSRTILTEDGQAMRTEDGNVAMLTEEA